MYAGDQSRGSGGQSLEERGSYFSPLRRLKHHGLRPASRGQTSGCGAGHFFSAPAKAPTGAPWYGGLEVSRTSRRRAPDGKTAKQQGTDMKLVSGLEKLKLKHPPESRPSTVYLHPGQSFVSQSPWQITTIVGSCV